MKFNRIEMALLIGFVATTIICASGIFQAEAVSDKLIRLHVVANSDSEEDQALKIKVRDEILPVIEKITSDTENVGEAQTEIQKKLNMISKVAEKCINQNGYDYTATVTIENTYFPSKDYDSFSLPAGEYEGLKIVIGDGNGKNWWCVLFPPLCVPAAEGEIEQVATECGLMEDDIAFITGDGCSYKIKFKSAEIYGEIKEWVKLKIGQD